MREWPSEIRIVHGDAAAKIALGERYKAYYQQANRHVEVKIPGACGKLQPQSRAVRWPIDSVRIYKELLRTAQEGLEVVSRPRDLMCRWMTAGSRRVNWEWLAWGRINCNEHLCVNHRARSSSRLVSGAVQAPPG